MTQTPETYCPEKLDDALIPGSGLNVAAAVAGGDESVEVSVEVSVAEPEPVELVAVHSRTNSTPLPLLEADKIAFGVEPPQSEPIPLETKMSQREPA
jgi:hypothetical protein